MVLIVLVLVVSAGVSYVVLRPVKAVTFSPQSIPIRHIVILMMENHAFDNFFGDYCPTAGPNCPEVVNGIPAGTCIPENVSKDTAPCLRPFPTSDLTPADMAHGWNSTIEAINGGAMNGWFRAESSWQEPFGYYTGTSIPIYWDLAQEYGLGDDFFSSALSYSLPNHWYLLAGQAPSESVNTSFLHSASSRHAYLNESNRTPTVEDELNRTPSVSWKYYDWSLPSYQVAINRVGPPGTFASAYDYWNPLAAKYESYTGWYVDHFVPRSSFFSDAVNGTLPDISWIMPGTNFSDHPPANLDDGQAFVASVVDAVESSPDWSSTALFIAWDDYGGFYDHVAPPRLDSLGLSFRVPLLVVSPYTPAGLVVHSLGYFESLLHFVEWRFGLGCLTARDCGAPLPLGYFDFNATPRAPVLFPTNIGMAEYPIGSLGAPGSLMPVADAASENCGAYCPIDPVVWNSAPPPPGTPYDDVD